MPGPLPKLQLLECLLPPPLVEIGIETEVEIGTERTEKGTGTETDEEVVVAIETERDDEVEIVTETGIGIVIVKEKGTEVEIEIERGIVGQGAEIEGLIPEIGIGEQGAENVKTKSVNEFSKMFQLSAPNLFCRVSISPMEMVVVIEKRAHQGGTGYLYVAVADAVTISYNFYR